ncbi:putative zinc finger protein CONSTANS-LIKE 11 [Senna tora]|uniref:Putative zinc finger protein CONSTANS-LIKE 11 n=1 Tax=Senna tora TaxID=362788 RepID=A0A834W996_9FABA|nr:putative zinc finger protein CONSTANS-LIKE 11 [Senna tora]
MSSDLYTFEAPPFHTHSTPTSQLVSTNGETEEEDLFFSCFSQIQLPLDEAELDLEAPPLLLDPFSPPFFPSSSSSPPTSHLRNLSLRHHHHHHHPLQSSESQLGNSSVSEENVSKLMMQRSFSSNSFDGNMPSYLYQYQYQTHPYYGTPSFRTQIQGLDSPDHHSTVFFTPQMRRVCSTGDLQYTCRKTLADSRPRIRGRFARNDDASEISHSKAPFSTTTRDEDEDEDEDHFWIEGLNEEQEDLSTIGTVGCVNGYGVPPHHFQYYGF